MQEENKLWKIIFYSSDPEEEASNLIEIGAPAVEIREPDTIICYFKFSQQDLEEFLKKASARGFSDPELIELEDKNWTQQCEAAAAEMCQRACTCGVDGEDCCWGIGGNSTCTSSFGCPSNAVGALCADPTVSPEELQLCRDELPSLTCGIEGALDMSGACASLYQPFM